MGPATDGAMKMPTADVVPQDLTASVVRLLDVQAIVDRLYAYCHAIDFDDSEGWLDCFTEDGSWVVESADGNLVYDLHGQDDLRRWIEETHTQGPKGFRHMTLNPRVVTINGDEAITAAYYLTSRIENDTLIMRGAGRYDDRLSRCGDGQWRIKSRKISRAFLYT
jgi:3-phenylpropionate/cinnamic acid dioxygenase small subunit